ncbi:MAG: hypothetical protein QS721_10345 [Candidatus Endonucleobacter sp. (ex Gigantidas childressi)]|nr:hypothetical protein [Candidatus Endonucleobacter sp. (ex Gigantidas childressi)]
MSRRPFVRPMKRTWFLDHPFYRSYMIRELSCVFDGLYGINLFVGLLQLKYGVDAWQKWLDFQGHPLMILFAVVTLGMTLYHSTTFIAMCPRVMPQQLRKLVPDKTVVVVSYMGFAAVSVVILTAIIWGVCI